MFFENHLEFSEIGRYPSLGTLTNKSPQMKSIKITAFLIVASFAMVGAALAEVMTVELKTGRSELVDVLGLSGDKIKVKSLKNGKVISFSISKLSDESQKKVLKKIKRSPSAYPPVEVKVSIGKRRESSSSSYEKSVSITSKLTVTNEDRTVECPPCKCNMIFIGQSDRYKDKYVVLSNQSFTIVPTNRGAVFASEPFVTTYSEYSGYKYVGYLVVVADKKKHVIYTKTIYPALKKALAKDPLLVSKMVGYKRGTYLNKSMTSSESELYDRTRF